MYAGKIVEQAEVFSLFANPLHPYTRGLLNALPRPGHRGSRLASIEGTVPSPLAYPPGCAFAPRCAQAFDACWERQPRLLEVEPGGGAAACWLYGEGEGGGKR
jgi:peptide/nickel transport system ATP-binding protein